MHAERHIRSGGLERRETMPCVSIIIPAFNAGSTLAATLESVRQQSFPDWEAIVVDDGSTDDTTHVAEALGREDARIRVLRQDNQGVSVARNTGIAAARGNWLLFLDADDTILPEHLTNLVRAVESIPGAGASVSNWIYATPDDRVVKIGRQPETGDLFDGLACGALFPIHTCLVQRDLVRQAGGFDASLRTCEDWDVWQRVARLGTRFVRCDGETAIYRMRPRSLSRDARQMLVDGLRVIETGFSRDPRVTNPAPAHAHGRQQGNPHDVTMYLVCWTAGELLGFGEDAREVLGYVEPATVDPIDPAAIANCIFEGAAIAACLEPSGWPRIWAAAEARIIAFLHALERRVDRPLLATRARRSLEQRILEASLAETPITIGTTHATSIEATAPVTDIQVPGGVERLRLSVTLEGERLGALELPVFSRDVNAYLIADALADRFAWQILDRFFSRTIYSGITIERAGDVTRVRRGDAVLLETTDSEPDDLRATLHERVGWTIFLQELWGRPAWQTDRFYDPHATDAAPHETIDMAGRTWIAVEASRDLPDLVTGQPVQSVLTAAGIALGVITLEPDGQMISAQHLRATISHAAGLELAHTCVREGLLGGPLSGPPLRQRLSALVDARQPVRQLNQGAGTPLIAGHVRIEAGAGSTPIYARRQSAPSLTSISRLSQVPAGTAGDLRLMTDDLSESTLDARHNVDGWYVPEIIPLGCPISSPTPPSITEQDIAPHEVAKTPQQPSIQRPAIARTVLRRVAREISKVSSHAATIPPPQPQPPVSQPASPIVTSDHIPVLMYHRVSPTGAKHMTRYRVTPEAFEAQLVHLREAGYQSVGVDELTRAIEARLPLAGRRVLLTFDDAYVDFAENAWPLLQRYGFSAILFVVSGCTGKTNAWDRRLGEELPLLGWGALRELQAAGVTIGAHSVTHPPLTGLAPREVAYEAAHSRRVIQQELGVPVHTFAYPYGDRDEAIERIAAACGFTLGFTCRSYPLHVNDPPLSLPRIEVEGSDDLTTFIRKLTV